MKNIKLKLKRVDPVKYAIIIGLLMALTTFIMMLIFMLLGSVIGGVMDEPGLAMIMGGGFVAVIIAPIFYGIFGFIFGLIGTALLNFILQKTDGLEMEFDGEGVDLSDHMIE